MQQQTRIIQEIFDKVITHLHKQNKQAFDYKKGACAYRGEDGTMCAVGCLIKDEHFNANFNVAPILNKGVIIMLLESGIPANQPNVQDVLRRLQKAHDNPDYRSKGFQSIVPKLNEIARAYELSTETLDKLTSDQQQ